ncbi:trehalose operon repressor [Halalkalibacterium halodurans]|uniref:Trehalose operon repressor n=1 Tax=Halalkalibacterium halodurans TaxID=86665 RepID=A0A0M0KC00_ALKHA|nr:trehalose operon repressor [Halalkalibacterium halodurans]TES54178.1 trehalose operon repressor [Halalkalibacterium halodurans]TPE70324.1 trehalose operon repressor [Halalkalibacterium halodurans]
MLNKYDTIYQQLAKEIDDGKRLPGEKLPSEHELTELFATSRETIRKALKLLSEHGYIQKIRGKGSIVLDRSTFDFPVSGLVSFKELAHKLGDDVVTTVHSLQKISANDFLQKQLGCDAEEPLWAVVRARKISGESIILDKDYFLEEYVPNLTKEICQDSIYEYVEKTLGLTISFAKKEMFVTEATEEDKQYLDLQNYDLVVVVRNYVYLDNAVLFEYTESRHRPDKFRFVDFARRNR